MPLGAWPSQISDPLWSGHGSPTPSFRVSPPAHTHTRTHMRSHPTSTYRLLNTHRYRKTVCTQFNDTKAHELGRGQESIHGVSKSVPTCTIGVRMAVWVRIRIRISALQNVLHVFDDYLRPVLPPARDEAGISGCGLHNMDATDGMMAPRKLQPLPGRCSFDQWLGIHSCQWPGRIMRCISQSSPDHHFRPPSETLTGITTLTAPHG